MSKIRPSLPPQRHVKKESISCFIAYFPQFFPQVITPGSNINSTSYASLPNLHGEILYSTKYARKDEKDNGSFMSTTGECGFGFSLILNSDKGD